MVCDIYNTTVNINGNKLFSSSYSLGDCCCGGMYNMNSCFGFGYGGYGYGGLGCGLGMGLGFAAGMALMPAMPNIFKGIGKGLTWFGTKVIAPAANFVWNKALQPAWTFTRDKVFKPIGKGVSNLWNKVFHKKSKTSKSD